MLAACICCRLRLQASPCGRQRSQSPARLESINGKLSAKPHCNRTSCLPWKLAFPCTLGLLKWPKIHSARNMYLGRRLGSAWDLCPFYTNPNNSISTTTKPSYHWVLAAALIIIWFAKLEGRDKEIKLACHYTQTALVASSLLPTMWKVHALKSQSLPLSPHQ